jgi:hypothetical protein
VPISLIPKIGEALSFIYNNEHKVKKILCIYYRYNKYGDFEKILIGLDESD